MVNDAEAHAEEDRKARESAEARNEADNLIYATEKSLSEYGDKITDDDRSSINSAIEELKSALDSGDTDTIKEKSEALKQASYKLAEEVYKNAGEQAGGAEQPEGATTEEGASESDEGVEDVDYEVVDEDKDSNS